MTAILQRPVAPYVHRVSWVIEADQLREHPAEWGLLAVRATRHGARSMASQINRGALWAFQPAGDFEARAEGNEVHARYLGDGELPA